MFVATKHIFSHDKYACRDKTFVATKVVLQQTILSRQVYFCHDKRHDKHVCHDKHMFVVARLVTTKIILAAPADDVSQALCCALHVKSTQEEVVACS